MRSILGCLQAAWLLSVACGKKSATVDVFDKDMVIGDTTYFCVKIPALVKLFSGSLLAFGEGRVGSCEDVAETHLIYRRSEDGGTSWGDAQVGGL